jgi:hypothetical protein
VLRCQRPLREARAYVEQLLEVDEIDAAQAGAVLVKVAKLEGVDVHDVVLDQVVKGLVYKPG